MTRSAGNVCERVSIVFYFTSDRLDDKVALVILFKASTGGSVVEFSPATREARVRFPASAIFPYTTVLLSFTFTAFRLFPLFMAIKLGNSILAELFSSW